MSDPQLSQLLDRAVHDAPAMHVDGAAMLAAGKGRVRRRRIAGVGALAGAAAVVVAVWSGLAGGGSVVGTPEIEPASTVWEDGQVVDASLFEGFQTIDGEQVGHTYAATLRRGATGATTLELSDGGDVLAEVQAQTPVPGLEVFVADRMTVAVWAEPEGVVTSVPLVGPVDPGGPTGRRVTEIDGTRIGYAVYTADVDRVPQVVRDVYLVGTDDVATLSGADVAVRDLQVGGERALVWSDAGRGVWGYSVDGVSQGTPDTPEAGLHQFLGSPALVSGWTWALEGRTVNLSLLPEGATDVALSDGVTGGQDSVEVDGRTFTLAETDDPDGDPAPRFTLGEQAYTFNDYNDDLYFLDTGDGSRLAFGFTPPTGTDVELIDEAGQVVLPLSTQELSPGLVVRMVGLEAGGSTVVLAIGWEPDATVLTDARVEVTDGDTTRWVTPSDVSQQRLADGRLVTLLATDAGSTVTGVGVATGSGDEVERWDPPVMTAGGIELRDVDGVVTPFVDGTQLEQVLAQADGDGPLDNLAGLGEARLYRMPGGADELLVLPPSLSQTQIALITRQDGRAEVRPDLSGFPTVVETDEGPVTLITLPAGTLGQGTVAYVVAPAISAGAVNTWNLTSGGGGVIALDGDVVLTVGGDGTWLAYPDATQDPYDLAAGVVGSSLVGLGWPDDDSRSQLVAVLPAGSTPELLLGSRGGFEVQDVATVPGPTDDLEVWTATLVAPGGPAEGDILGLDLDGDGEPDVKLGAY